MGDGAEREQLERLARRRGMADRVSFEEFVPSLRMPDFYRKLDGWFLKAGQKRKNRLQMSIQ